jgi:hypothetical protein
LILLHNLDMTRPTFLYSWVSRMSRNGL